MMQRRAFLTLLAGGTVALSIGRYVSLPASNQFWRWTKFHNFHQSQDAAVWMGQLVGERSDGVHFCCHVPIGAEEMTQPATVQVTMENAFNTLNSFLDCDCRVGRPCDVHYVIPYDGWSENAYVEDNS